MGIIVLDQITIDKIAAGEVIENPASVVKELVENSIDAGASVINVEIKDGGTGFIRVTDDGGGIHQDDIKKAFLKHATSKIKTIDDITGVETLGFRGEALSSIASVSRTRLTSRMKGSESGYTYNVEGGNQGELSETGVPEGTTMVVEELFYNTPARKKFLKSASSEGAVINSLMDKFALSRPDISFKLTSDGKEKLNTTGNGNLKEVIYAIYGKEITDNLIEIDHSEEDVKIKGFIGKPAVSRGNRSFEHYAINGRYIKNESLTGAIEDAYKGYIMLHNFPFTALLFEINPELLDVNVHPAKREFRLTTSEKVCASVRDALRAAIEKSNIIPEVTPDQKDVSEEKEDRSSQGAHFLHERSFNSSVMADGLFGGGNSEAITSDEIEAAMEKEEAEVAERIAKKKRLIILKKTLSNRRSRV